MSIAKPGRPTVPDDLDRAYARAHALADDGARPSAAVRANVLAVALAVAARSASHEVDGMAGTSTTTLPLTPVAAPVSAIGLGRARAVNLSSWRMRSGAAFCAALLVSVAAWHFDTSRRFGVGTEVALAEKPAMSLEVLPPPPLPPRLELPLPSRAVPVSPAASADLASPEGKAAHGHGSMPDARARIVVAQAELPPLPPLLPPTVVAESVAEPSLVIVPPATPAPAAVMQAPMPDKNLPQGTTLAGPPSLIQRRSAGANLPAPAYQLAQADETRGAVAQPEIQQVQITGIGASMQSSISARTGASAIALSKPLLNASPRLQTTPLQAAADRGDLEALDALLANPATRVDEVDADGRTALLHAVMSRQAGAVRRLLAAGADRDHADQTGLTPRAAALTGANAEIAALLGKPDQGPTLP